MNQLGAAFVCSISLYGVEAYYYDGWYTSHISALLSQILHFCP